MSQERTFKDELTVTILLMEPGFPAADVRSDFIRKLYNPWPCRLLLSFAFSLAYGKMQQMVAVVAG